MTTGSPRHRPAPLLLAVILLAVEGVAAAGFGAFEIPQIRSNRLVLGVGVVVVMFGLALLLIGSARALTRLRRWGRGPAVALQLILLPTAWSFRGAPTTWVGLLLAGIAILALIGLLHPRTTEALVSSDPDRIS